MPEPDPLLEPVARALWEAFDYMLGPAPESVAAVAVSAVREYLAAL